ncbi:amino acid adenylation domain-containing protein [Amycolatopsis sp. NPDC003731]
MASTLPETFLNQVRRRPEAVAVRSADGFLTFDELNRRANRLANLLIEHGVEAEQPVAVCLGRSFDLVVATLAVIKAGATYVPLATSMPTERLRSISDQLKVRMVITDGATPAATLSSFGEVITTSDAEQAQESEPVVSVAEDQLAYVLFTSGSAGAPKGVGVSHRSVIGLIEDQTWNDSVFSRILMIAPYAFGMSTFELWAPLLRGGQIVLAHPGEFDIDALRDDLRRGEATAVHLTSGLFRLVAEEDPTCLSSVREVMTGGDVVSPEAVRRILSANPDIRVRVMYGQTETTLFATQLSLTQQAQVGAFVPLGQALDDKRLYVLDESLNRVVEGGVGELYVAGGCLARGYVDRPDLTAERFVADPFGAPGERMFRTGDLVRQTAGGSLEFLGRADQQIKVRGFRVELGEVEAALRTHPAVADAVVVGTSSDEDQRLAAYVVPCAGGVDFGELRTHLGRALPDYMVPAAFTAIDAIPVTVNGKVDRDALPEPEFDRAKQHRAPLSPRQETLCAIFSKTLNVDQVGLDDSFFDLGGQSLQAARLVLRIEAELGVKLSVVEIFDVPTVALIDQHITAIHGDQVARAS